MEATGKAAARPASGGCAVPAAGHEPERDVYLDYAAATPMAPEVLDAMLPYFSERFENPSAPYRRARAVRRDVEDARGRLARCLGARPDNVTLTAGATEANNLAIAAADGAVAVSAIEHESVMAAADAAPGGRAVIPVDSAGRVSPEDVADAITPETGLVSVALANGEIGTIQPIRAISQVVARERERRLEAGERRPIWLHTDASQAAGCLSVNVSTLGADLITVSAAKIYGPKQVGLLWAADGLQLRPLILGGGQERGARSGTENVAGIIGFARALELSQGCRKTEAARLQKLRDGLQRHLEARFPWCVVSGPKKDKERLPGLLHVSFPGLEARRLVVLLERAGVSVGTGSACAASKMQVSAVLRAIGASEEVARGSLRITLGAPTTEDDLGHAAHAIEEAVTAECQRVGIDDADGRPITGR